MQQPVAPSAFVRSRESAPAYWFIDILWLVLVDGHDSGGTFSVMEQWMHQGAGPPLFHVHPIDEWFYVLEGDMTVEMEDRPVVLRAGDSLWISRGTAHRFKVTSSLCRVLNGYTPAGFEQVIIGLAEPAERRELPPPMDRPDQEKMYKLFNNYWSSESRDQWALSRLGMR
jgi:mannose-6-phosphate isomerase-like protein (cupin superfamily)